MNFTTVFFKFKVRESYSLRLDRFSLYWSITAYMVKDVWYRNPHICFSKWIVWHRISICYEVDDVSLHLITLFIQDRHFVLDPTFIQTSLICFLIFVFLSKLFCSRFLYALTISFVRTSHNFKIKTFFVGKQTKHDFLIWHAIRYSFLWNLIWKTR